MRKEPLDLVGQRFGKLVVIAIHPERLNYHYYWQCACDCGVTKLVRQIDLTRGATQGCGRLCGKTQHLNPKPSPVNRSYHPVYRAFIAAQARCSPTDEEHYPDYAGRGIEFRFSSFEEFVAELGDKPTSKHTVDRINNDGHYEVGNVKWSTRTEQNNNRRNNRVVVWNEQTHTLAEWSRILNLPVKVLTARLNRDWAIQDAFTTPILSKGVKYKKSARL